MSIEIVNSEIFEENNVHKIYDSISQHFSCTRKIIWPKVNDFINQFEKGSTILDIGCGNGKNMGTREDCQYVGIDTCINLINQAEEKKNCKYFKGNCLDIPLENNSIEYVMSIAVIHHLSSVERRLKALQEIERVLKIGGKALIYVWAYEQEKFKNETSQDVKVRWMLQKKYNTDNKDEVLYRYYHLFKHKELEILIKKINTFSIIESGEQCNNWYCIIKKI